MFSRNKALKVLLTSIILLALLIVSGEQLLDSVSRLSPLQFLFIAALQLLTLILVALQSWYVLICDNGGGIPYVDVFNINLGAKIVESITPSVKFGGESARIYLYNRIFGLKIGNALAAVSWQKITSLAGLVILLPPFMYFAPVGSGLWGELLISNPEFSFFPGNYSIFVLLAAAGILLLILRYKKDFLLEKLSEIMADLNASSRRILGIKNLTFLLSLSALYWILYPLKLYFLARFIQVELGFFTAVAATFLAYLVSMLPLTPGGLGGFEATMAFVLSQSGISWSAGISLALLLRVFTFWLPLGLSILSAYNLPVELSLSRGGEAGHDISN